MTIDWLNPETLDRAAVTKGWVRPIRVTTAWRFTATDRLVGWWLNRRLEAVRRREVDRRNHELEWEPVAALPAVRILRDGGA